MGERLEHKGHDIQVQVNFRLGSSFQATYRIVRAPQTVLSDVVAGTCRYVKGENRNAQRCACRWIDKGFGLGIMLSVAGPDTLRCSVERREGKEGQPPLSGRHRLARFFKL